MKRLFSFSLLLVGLCICSCSDNDGARVETSVYADKIGPLMTEEDLVADSALALTSENVVMIELENPDLIGDQVDTTNKMNDTGDTRGLDVVHMDISEEKAYLFCLRLQDNIDDEITVKLLNSTETVFLSMEDTSCREVLLTPDRYGIKISRTSDGLGGVDLPFFLTMEDDLIQIMHNQCTYCDLENADLSNKEFVNTDFSGAMLKNANFSNTIMQFVNFSGAALDGASFENASTIQSINMPSNASSTDKRKGSSMFVHNLDVSVKVLGWFDIKHTYPIVIGHQAGKRFAWGSLGGATGGKELEDTRTSCDGCIDLETVSYIMTQEPCAWPKKTFYAVVGVCWNLTNRGLYYTGKTVHKVPYYAAVETYFRTYGLENSSLCAPAPWETDCKKGRRRFAWQKCLEAVEKKHPWNDGDTATKTANATYVENPWEANPDLSIDDIDPRIRLFQSFHDDMTGDAASLSSEDEGKDLDYLQALLLLNLRENVGELDDAQTDGMLKAHADMYYALRSLPIDDEKEYTRQFNEIMNKTMAKYKEILGQGNFLKLMNLEKDEPFDIMNHVLRDS